MPTYTRHCLECDHVFDKMLKMAEKDTASVECPYCGALDGSWMVTACHTSMESARFTNKKDTGFHEVISKIKERNPRTAICER